MRGPVARCLEPRGEVVRNGRGGRESVSTRQQSIARLRPISIKLWPLNVDNDGGSKAPSALAGRSRAP
jgi:hypothetical protein